MSSIKSSSFRFYSRGAVPIAVSALFITLFQFFPQSRNRHSAVFDRIESEIQVILNSQHFWRAAGLSPWSPNSVGVSPLVAEFFLKGTSTAQIRGILESALTTIPEKNQRERKSLEQWISDLMDLDLEERIESSSTEAASQLLRRARYRLALGQGWYQSGNQDKALLNLLGALLLVRGISEQKAESSEYLEAQFIAGAVLLHVFNRPMLLAALRDLKSTNVWSFKAGKLLSREFRP